LPQTTIIKAINDLRKRLNARVFGAFWTFCTYYVNCVVVLNMG